MNHIRNIFAETNRFYGSNYFGTPKGHTPSSTEMAWHELHRTTRPKRENTTISPICFLVIKQFGSIFSVAFGDQMALFVKTMSKIDCSTKHPSEEPDAFPPGNSPRLVFHPALNQFRVREHPEGCLPACEFEFQVTSSGNFKQRIGPCDGTCHCHCK